MKWLIALFSFVLLFGLGLSLLWQSDEDFALDTVEVNRIIRNVEADFPAALDGHLPDSSLVFTFVPLGQSVHTHIQNRDTLVDVTVDGEVVGQVAFSHGFADSFAHVQTRLSAIFYGQFLLLVIICVFFILYQRKTIMTPFAKLKAFATQVAAGNLDAPLAMDKENRFGAFSESFDLMRDQLAIARENERLANISKKELVASLSHDIKTPAAAIKVMAELHTQKHGETHEMQTIIQKVDQIDRLVSDMFHATLEELQQLKVCPEEISTAELAHEIVAADSMGKVKPFSLPECIVIADRLRFGQLIGNVIENAYKYADSALEVSGDFDGDFFVLTVRDFGPGVPDAFLPLLTEKFYRAPNAEGKAGAGLGLYLANYFMCAMGGSLELVNAKGLCVIMRFQI